MNTPSTETNDGQPSHVATITAVRGKATVETKAAFEHSWEVRCIFIILCLFSFLGGLDGTIITTSLPIIARDIGGSEQLYVWIAQSYLFSSTVTQPFYGQVISFNSRLKLHWLIKS